MKLRRAFAVSRKEYIHIIRDPRSLILGLIVPVVMMLLFGYALALDVDKVPIVVRDADMTPASREFISRFAGTPYFRIVDYCPDYAALERAIDERTALAALSIPQGFSSDIARSRTAHAQFIIDGSDSGTATTALGYADMIARGYSASVALEQASRKGVRPPSAPIDVRPRVEFNEDMESRNFIIPGLIGVIMMVMAALLTSLTVAKEWETGTMEQLIATPVRGPEVVIGKLLPYLSIGIFDVIVAMLMGVVVFAVPLRGSVPLAFGIAAVFTIGALSLGVLISVLAKGQLVATQIAFVATFLPAFLLSGFMFDIANMPKVIQVVTFLVPARYLVTVLRGIYLKGVGLEVLWPQAVFLVAFAIIVVALAILRFRKKLG
ncbi:MAG: ABC transporter permease [Candidatus Brocadiia bacterium]